MLLLWIPRSCTSKHPHLPLLVKAESRVLSELSSNQDPPNLCLPSPTGIGSQTSPGWSQTRGPSPSATRAGITEVHHHNYPQTFLARIMFPLWPLLQWSVQICPSSQTEFLKTFYLLKYIAITWVEKTQLYPQHSRGVLQPSPGSTWSYMVLKTSD
jgi:hypothetical protein